MNKTLPVVCMILLITLPIVLGETIVEKIVDTKITINIKGWEDINNQTRFNVTLDTEDDNYEWNNQHNTTNINQEIEIDHLENITCSQRPILDRLEEKYLDEDWKTKYEVCEEGKSHVVNIRDKYQDELIKKMDNINGNCTIWAGDIIRLEQQKGQLETDKKYWQQKYVQENITRGELIQELKSKNGQWILWIALGVGLTMGARHLKKKKEEESGSGDETFGGREPASKNSPQAMLEKAIKKGKDLFMEEK